MSNIVVGVDLSPECERAIAHGIATARRTGDAVVLVMVDHVPDPPATLSPAVRALDARYVDPREGLLGAHREALGALRGRWTGQGVEVSQLVVDGYPDERLPAAAQELHADLIVVGSHGRTGLKRFWFGSVAEQVVRHAQQSVLIARGDPPVNGYRRVVIGTDFSVSAGQAMLRALPFVADDAQLELVHCWQAPWTGGADVPQAATTESSFQAELESRLRAEATRLRVQVADRPGIRVTMTLAHASPARGLVERVADGADLLVVGSHGRRGIDRLLLGSVAEVATRQATSSVLVARPLRRG